MLTLLLTLIQLTNPTGLVHAQHGILPGEPDPNTSPKHDIDNSDAALIDDRKPCPKGEHRIQKMKCGTPEEAKHECDNYSPVLICGKKPMKISCKKPKVPVPIYQCE